MSKNRPRWLAIVGTAVLAGIVGYLASTALHPLVFGDPFNWHAGIPAATGAALGSLVAGVMLRLGWLPRRRARDNGRA